MIGNITKGAGFGGVFAYVLAEDKNFTLLTEAQQCLATTPEELAREFQYVANLRSRTTQPVRHYSIAFAPIDGEIDTDVKSEIAVRIMTEMGFADSQYFAVAHDRDDPNHHEAHDHDHIHIVANAIKPDGSKVNHAWDFHKLELCLRGIEKDYGFRELDNSWEVPKVPKTIGRTELQEKIDRALENSPDLQGWLDRLAEQQVNVRFKLTNTGKVQGISYIHNNELKKGGDVERNWGSIGSQFDSSPNKLELMRSANLRTQTLPIILRRHEQEQLNKAADLGMSKLDGNTNYKDKSVKILFENETLSIQRLRPAKRILTAKKDADGQWQCLGIPDIDKKDLQVLEDRIAKPPQSPRRASRTNIPNGSPVSRIESIANIIPTLTPITDVVIASSIEASSLPEEIKAAEPNVEAIDKEVTEAVKLAAIAETEVTPTSPVTKKIRTTKKHTL